jgi:hypothetical protein
MDRTERSEEKPGVFRVKRISTFYAPVAGDRFEKRQRIYSYFENAKGSPLPIPAVTEEVTPAGPKWRLMLASDPPALQAQSVPYLDGVSVPPRRLVPA